MNGWKQLRRVLQDPPPAYAFEISRDAIAYSRQLKPIETGLCPLEPGVLKISPLKDNVEQPETLFECVRSLAPANGRSRRRTAALILPDYCARVTMLDFDNFPSDRNEQLALVRFRMKKSIPFDLDSARLSYYVQSGGGSRKHEVVAMIAALEIVARYEAAFRSAGFEPGYVTISTLAALNLISTDGVSVLAKLSGPVLTTTVTGGEKLKLVRCIELPEVSTEEVMRILYPTFAYVEDELKAKPASLVLCGFGGLAEEITSECRRELGVPVEQLRSRLGEPDQTNAGLLGLLEKMRD